MEGGAKMRVRGLKLKRQIDPVNIGDGEGISILELARRIKKIVGWEQEIKLDISICHQTIWNNWRAEPKEES